MSKRLGTAFRLPIDSNDLAATFLGSSELVSFYPPIPLGVDNPETFVWSASRRELGGETVKVYIELPYTVGTFAQQGRRFFGVPMPGPRPQATLGADGRVYATASDEYQVLALNDEGEALWALRVAMSSTSPTEREIQQVLDALRESRDGLRRDQENWPGQHPVIARLRLDGAGNLFVFPYYSTAPVARPADTTEEQEPVPVDVYSPEGERIFAGFISIPDWSVVFGDHVYRLEADPMTDEPVVVRYHFVEPFE